MSDEQKVYESFEKIGIYGICIQSENKVSYRYVTKYPRISKEEFEQISDGLIAKCTDIDYIIRSLEHKGFRKLKCCADMYYNLNCANIQMCR